MAPGLLLLLGAMGTLKPRTLLKAGAQESCDPSGADLEMVLFSHPHSLPSFLLSVLLMPCGCWCLDVATSGFPDS